MASAGYDDKSALRPDSGPIGNIQNKTVTQ